MNLEKELTKIVHKMVKCIHCEHILPSNKFWKQRNGNPQNVCKNCYNKRNKKWREKNPEKSKCYSKKWYQNNPTATHRHKLKYRYGITIEEYNSILESQNNKCAICNKEETIRKNLSVDHDHDTGINRGLLCDKCNKSLGGFNDSIDTLLSAVSYLTKYKSYYQSKKN